MIRSQQNLDVTTVSVERHKVQRVEKVVSNIFSTFVGLYFVGSIALIVYGLILDHIRDP